MYFTHIHTHTHTFSLSLSLSLSLSDTQTYTQAVLAMRQKKTRMLDKLETLKMELETAFSSDQKAEEEVEAATAQAAAEGDPSIPQRPPQRVCCSFAFLPQRRHLPQVGRCPDHVQRPGVDGDCPPLQWGYAV